MSERVYLDWNATAPLRRQARGAMLAALDIIGNPSSVHAEGRAARRVVEEAREKVAALAGTEPRNVVFTSGGTEANTLALSPAIEHPGGKQPRDRLLVSAIEHPSVRSGGRFPAGSVEEVPVTPEGVVDLAALERRLALLRSEGMSRPLVSIMHANNETGVLQPVAAAAAIVHAADGLLHVDAVQTFGRIRCNINEMGADLLTVSAHKLGGPKGAGALIKRSDALHLADPAIKGGGQERGSRAGTEHVAGIAGFGAAAAAAAESMAEEGARARILRDVLEDGLRTVSPSAVTFGAAADRLSNTCLFAVPGTRAETALIGLDLGGIAASSGAACSSGKVMASHVLAAMHVDAELAGGAIRVSLGWTTTEAEIECFLQAWRKLISRLSNKEKRGLAA